MGIMPGHVSQIHSSSKVSETRPNYLRYTLHYRSYSSNLPKNYLARGNFHVGLHYLVKCLVLRGHSLLSLVEKYQKQKMASKSVLLRSIPRKSFLYTQFFIPSKLLSITLN